MYLAMPNKRAHSSGGPGTVVRIEPLLATDYDEMVALWKAAGLTYRPRGRDSRKEIARQLRTPAAIFLKAVVAKGAGTRVQGAGLRVQGTTKTDHVTVLVFGPRHRRSLPCTLLSAPCSLEPIGKILGVVLGSHDERRGWINRLAVLPEYQKSGIGGILVRELEKRFDRLGLLLVAVQVDKGNRGSLRFFKGCGFRLHDDIHYLSKRKGDWA